ncbi:Chromosome transmission fidelity protein [Drechslerella dactyloides]|uniref:Chromosome transmission fidelity protein n=1 Tax=Drechslerella dactyloides TaxID=74499 RepID=A0AAD6NJ56_DREDA|nr:Chromosome transmission fidelity protein [Drechslerella dactyloides]
MPSTPLHLPDPLSVSANANPLPQLLRLPTGLAILELQGDINYPSPHDSNADTNTNFTTVGNLIFPDATSDSTDPKDLKRVWLYVGKHQRLTGEVKALPKPLGVLRKKQTQAEEAGSSGVAGGNYAAELEIVDIIRYKIIFSKRPEPVSAAEQ